MAFLYNKRIRQFVLFVILAWGTWSFFVVNQMPLAKVLVLLLAFISFIFIIFEISPIFILISLSFMTAYSLYSFLLQLGLPLWVLMIAIFVLFGFLFTYTEQKIGILGNKRLIYLVLFSLIILEVFLILSYFLINPLSQSLIIAAISYLFIGFCYTVLARHEDNSFGTYIFYTLLVIFLVLVSFGWQSV
ncbi:MAG: hypothetical protein WCG48_01965 [Candidatus Berkelbacteria bacterium]